MALIIGRVRFGLPGVALCLFLSAGLFPQEARKPEAPQARLPKSSAKPVLAEATRVSTDDAIKSAAKKEPESPTAETPVEESTNSAVTELHPAKNDPGSSRAAEVKTVQTGKKSWGKNIHGTVYGASGQGTDSSRRTGGSLGASSKSGKTSIYVETNRARETQRTTK